MAGNPPVQTRMTIDEFRRLPESDDHPELINGALVMSPTPVYRHQHMVGQLFALLHAHARQGLTVLSPMDVYIDGNNVVQPDLFWVHNDRGQCVPREGYWHGSPDLVVEVLSPATEKRDRGLKFKIYQESGVREYWIADPRARFIEVFLLAEGQFVQQGLYAEGQSFSSPVLEGLRVEIDPLLPVITEED
jgi:Uma2 family endonuclease